MLTEEQRIEAIDWIKDALSKHDIALYLDGFGYWLGADLDVASDEDLEVILNDQYDGGLEAFLLACA